MPPGNVDGPHGIRIVRVYDDVGPSAGRRILVDRLWPRGVTKQEAPIDEWLKDVAPSSELRRWYGHVPDRFEEFDRRYRDELTRSPAREALDGLRRQARSGDLILVTATKDVGHSAAAVLHSLLGP
ncbi:MAG: DUF488 family protein [Candidatus Dormiibacterota bacterium]